ncbi:DUF2326 domain-containing protein [Clostridium cagae]|uniref:DUF2326 domain-containing protein n=1 Tax=Clostridium cagae TaxID=2080751 RepID=UPI003F75CC9D
MIFEELIIYSYKDKRILKEFKFNKVGVSIILGEKDRDKIEGDSNGVGKTTFVELIRCILGQKFQSKFLKSRELIDNAIFVYMKCLIDNKTIFLGKHISSQDGYILYSEKVDFNLDKWERYSEEKYRYKVQELLVENNNELYNVKLASLNEYIIRDEEIGFVDIIRPKRHEDISTACLMYLCRLPYWFEMEINKIKNEINKLKSKKNYINSLDDDIADIRIQKKKLRKEIDDLNKNISNLNIISNIELYEERYKKAKEQYSILKKDMLKKQRQMKQYKRNISSLRQNKENSKMLLELEEFYNQIMGYFPEKLIKSYNEVVEFYTFMDSNRGQIYENNMFKLDNDIKLIKEKISNLEKNISQYSDIINNNDFLIDYNYLTNELNEKYKKLSEIEYKINVYDSKKGIIEDINDYKADILKENKKLQDLFKEYDSIRKNITNDFEEMVKYVYNQEGELSLEYNNSVDGCSNTGRIKIHCKIPDEDSHGIKTMKIMMFDIACLLSRIRNDDEIQFLVHV